jgi:hypothetical protein
MAREWSWFLTLIFRKRPRPVEAFLGAMNFVGGSSENRHEIGCGHYQARINSGAMPDDQGENRPSHGKSREPMSASVFFCPVALVPAAPSIFLAWGFDPAGTFCPPVLRNQILPPCSSGSN